MCVFSYANVVKPAKQIIKRHVLTHSKEPQNFVLVE